MNELTMLEVQLLDEYYRCERNLSVFEKRLEEAEYHGYISRKNIRGCESFYLQWREGDKVKSKYVKKQDLDAVTKVLERNKYYKKNIKKLKHSMKILTKTLGKKKIEAYRGEI